MLQWIYQQPTWHILKLFFWPHVEYKAIHCSVFQVLVHDFTSGKCCTVLWTTATAQFFLMSAFSCDLTNISQELFLFLKVTSSQELWLNCASAGSTQCVVMFLERCTLGVTEGYGIRLRGVSGYVISYNVNFPLKHNSVITVSQKINING